MRKHSKRLLEDITDRIYQVKLRKRIRVQEIVPELLGLRDGLPV